MSAATAYPHIEKPDAEPARIARMPRTRVAQIVMDYLAHAWSPEEVCRQYPYLTRAEVHTAMAYYFDHRQEIDDEIRAELKLADEARASAATSPFLLRMQGAGRG